ncbi:MAG: hypothetical protein J0L62_02725 [Bacteroidetes bacterium]|nr:hypothetical protein [Bacteroidota bacterium]
MAWRNTCPADHAESTDRKPNLILKSANFREISGRKVLICQGYQPWGERFFTHTIPEPVVNEPVEVPKDNCRAGLVLGCLFSTKRSPRWGYQIPSLTIIAFLLTIPFQSTHALAWVKMNFSLPRNLRDQRENCLFLP